MPEFNQQEMAAKILCLILPSDDTISFTVISPAENFIKWLEENIPDRYIYVEHFSITEDFDSDFIYHFGWRDKTISNLFILTFKGYTYESFESISSNDYETIDQLFDDYLVRIKKDLRTKRIIAVK